MHGPGYNTFPAIYRQFIYFLSSGQARDQFMQEPMTYLAQPTPKPVVPIRMAIIGPPKAGKTASMYNHMNKMGKSQIYCFPRFDEFLTLSWTRRLEQHFWVLLKSLLKKNTLCSSSIPALCRWVWAYAIIHWRSHPNGAGNPTKHRAFKIYYNTPKEGSNSTRWNGCTSSRGGTDGHEVSDERVKHYNIKHFLIWSGYTKC